MLTWCLPKFCLKLEIFSLLLLHIVGDRTEFFFQCLICEVRSDSCRSLWTQDLKPVCASLRLPHKHKNRKTCTSDYSSRWAWFRKHRYHLFIPLPLPKRLELPSTTAYFQHFFFLQTLLNSTLTHPILLLDREFQVWSSFSLLL